MIKNLIAIGFSMLLPATLSQAKEEDHTSKQTLFILQGKTRSVQVVHTDQEKLPDKVYMRLPDLGGESSSPSSLSQPSTQSLHGQSNGKKISENAHGHAAEHGTKNLNPHKTGNLQAGQKNIKNHSVTSKTGQDHSASPGHSLSHPEELQEKSSATGVLAFSSEKIRGVVRLPRVRFARVGLPMELREEAPSLDFNDKTLKEHDF